MQPLPLTRAQLAEYHERLVTSHDFELHIDLLDMEERHVGSLTDAFEDGQVNLQRDATIKRTATFQLYDPGHSLHLDSGSPFTAGAVFADRMIRARHELRLSDGTEVVATAFVGPLVVAGRDGDVLHVECQDKSALAMTGCPPRTVKKGASAVGAVRTILEDCAGERHFRFPASHKARLSRAYSTGWTDEAAPWLVAQKIARNELNMDLIYSSDGYATLRPAPRSPVLTLTEGGLVLRGAGDGVAAITGLPRIDYDTTSVRNHVRVTGQRKPKKGKKQVKFTETATARPTHPLAPGKLGRNGVPRYLPLVVDDSSIHKAGAAKARARKDLAANLPMSVTMQVPTVPFFHLDYGDIIRVRSDLGDANLPFVLASIPLGLSGDASAGAQRRVSTPRRR